MDTLQQSSQQLVAHMNKLIHQKHYGVNYVVKALMKHTSAVMAQPQQRCVTQGSVLNQHDVPCDSSYMNKHRMGFCNFGWWGKWLVMKQKYHGFQPSAQSDAADMALIVNIKTLVHNLEFQAILEEMTTFFCNINNVICIPPNIAEEWVTVSWANVDKNAKKTGRGAVPTHAAVNQVNWFLTLEQEHSLCWYGMWRPPTVYPTVDLDLDAIFGDENDDLQFRQFLESLL
jgi:hypothetical protein